MPTDDRSGERERLGLLRRLGFGELEHDSHVPFLSHLVATRRLMREWECPAAWCDAALFHSAYGTEYFESGADIDRSEVVAIIGAEAERLAWLWCSMRRHTIELVDDAGGWVAARAENRHSGEMIEMTATEIRGIATLWAADAVEQIARMTPEERGFADGFSRVRHLVVPTGLAAVAASPELADP